jgi:hypothetical protein
MAGLTMVFDGKVKPAASQMCFIDLDSPFTHDSTKNLAVMVECNYGGTGLSTHPTQSNESITPSTNKHLAWYANSSPPAGNGNFIGYLPVTWLVFLKETGSPVGTISGRPLCSYDSLYWTNNANNDSVIILFNHTGVKPYLVNGTTYNGYGAYGTAGDTIVFKGKASSWVHSNVKPSRDTITISGISTVCTNTPHPKNVSSGLPKTAPEAGTLTVAAVCRLAGLSQSLKIYQATDMLIRV